MINVVTKSGTNDLRGSVFEFYRDQALNANNAINVLNNRPKSPYHYNQFGGTLGGPIRPNRDFFFFNYDGQRNTQPNLVFLNLPANTPTDAATQAGIAQLEPLADSWNRALNQDVFLIKTDHELTDTNRLSFRYNQQNFTGEGFENGGPQNSSQHTGASLVKTNTFNGSWTSIFGTTVFNELRFQWARDKEPGLANSANPEAVVQQSGTTVLTIGRNNFSPRETTISRWQVADTVTWLRGQHKFKGGFDFQFDDILNNFPGFFSGSYTFRTLASFAGGRPNGANEFYQQNFGGAGTTGPETHPNIHEYSFFVQDEWRPRSELTHQHGAALRPDEDCSTAGAQSRRSARRRGYRHEPVGCRHQQLGPASRCRVEPRQFRQVRRSRRLGAVLRPDAVDHARHSPLEQRHQYRVADLHRRHGAGLSRQLRRDSQPRHGRAPEHLLCRQRLRELAR